MFKVIKKVPVIIIMIGILVVTGIGCCCSSPCPCSYPYPYPCQTQTTCNCPTQSCQCEESITRAFTACACDKFESPIESPVPSQTLLDWIDFNYASRDDKLIEELRGTRACDEEGLNRYWAHTFLNLTPPTNYRIQSAILTITVKNGHYNDSLGLGFITNDSSPWLWSSRLTALGINVGSSGTITLNLSTVLSLADIASHGFLDIAVQDDSSVDCATLEVNYVPSCCPESKAPPITITRTTTLPPMTSPIPIPATQQPTLAETKVPTD